MRSERVTINGNAYIRYDGPHDELVGIVRKGDLVTLRMQTDDGVESIKVTGTVTAAPADNWTGVSVGADDRPYRVSSTGNARNGYMVMCVKRPIENVLPDSPGLWADDDGAVWCVLKNDRAYCIRYESGNWQDDMPTCLAPIALLADRVPFTKLTLTEEER